MSTVSKPYRWKGRIRFVDTDASKRIHYTAMFRHFEAAEHDFMREIGWAYTSPELHGVSFPRVHVECDFQAEIHYDDVIEVELRVERVGTSSFTIALFVTVEGKPSAKGRITIVAVDVELKQSCAIPEKMAQVLREHLG